MAGFRIWLAATALAIAAAVAVPYGLLGEGAPLAVFLFWCGFGLAVIALIAAGVARWRL
ncbi:hypothetical protein [Rhodosalinus sediminis]|jgi:hypothetical protein|uniref:hypothetical protein n=1 Tax=Rhodosalinus sediminis TaxID=1940533 RepID=UPI0013149C57|nr:hypothetical protein [Rhodosalinus sediminis]